MKTEQTDHGPLETWTVEEVAEAFARGEIAIVDVRSPPEYMLEHIPGALLMPMNGFAPQSLPVGGKKRLVLHCGSGMRSGKMARRMLEAGLGPVAHMEGGFGAWKAAGQAYVGVDPATGAPKRQGGS
ncbi:rhodanese-like domain-containing protein [Pararhodobacter sp. SW119]|uniref:rhodanese-like domain-containing protein n=1 Tax=Pararhodobacter sp. SW119 TaxID=2780075 RepID=UPI001AE0B21F|nr:rhodanese-like domain-containing protein [Pararhodobacter sp. SW119]